MTIDKHQCIANAEALLANPTPERLRYAALELRICMEVLTYEKLRSYSKRIPEEVLKKWQPPQAVKALLEFEPFADQNYTLSIGEQEGLGKIPKEMKIIGQHHALKLDWLNKHYHKIGNLLHAPAITNAPIDEDIIQLKEYLLKVIEDLKAPISNNVTSTVGEIFTPNCIECKQPIICNARAIRKSQRATCLNSQCKAQYFVTFLENGDAKFDLITTNFPCVADNCNGEILLVNNKIKFGLKFKCPECGLQHEIADKWVYGVR